MDATLARAAGMGVIAAAVAAGPAMGQASFEGLGVLRPDLSSFVAGISPDGAVVVGRGMHRLADGSTAGRPVRWTGTGIQVLPGFVDGEVFDAEAMAAAAGGGVIVGNGTYLGGVGNRGFRHAGGVTTMLPLGAGQAESGAWGVTPDGATVVGRAGTAPAYWVGDGMPVTIPLLPGAIRGTALAVSADGSRIVGSVSDGMTSGAFRWSAATGSEPIPLPAGLVQNVSLSISADGGTVAGSAANSMFISQAFRWTESGGTQVLPVLPGGVLSAAHGCSANGSIIVGSVFGPGLGERAVLWGVGDEVVDLNVLLPTLGVDLTGWTLSAATAISADGLTIAGHGRHIADGVNRTEAWVVTIPGPGAGIGLVLGAMGAGQYGGRRRRRP